MRCAEAAGTDLCHDPSSRTTAFVRALPSASRCAELQSTRLSSEGCERAYYLPCKQMSCLALLVTWSYEMLVGKHSRSANPAVYSHAHRSVVL
eukprot:2777702-Rhodomonas_salina.1